MLYFIGLGNLVRRYDFLFNENKPKLIKMAKKEGTNRKEKIL